MAKQIASTIQYYLLIEVICLHLMFYYFTKKTLKLNLFFIRNFF